MIVQSISEWLAEYYQVPRGNCVRAVYVLRLVAFAFVTLAFSRHHLTIQILILKLRAEKLVFSPEGMPLAAHKGRIRSKFLTYGTKEVVWGMAAWPRLSELKESITENVVNTRNFTDGGD
jgi:hypothetical protein